MHSFGFLKSFVQVKTIFNNDRCCVHAFRKDIFVLTYNPFKMGMPKEFQFAVSTLCYLFLAREK